MEIRKESKHVEQQRTTYCNECEDLVVYDITDETITEKFKGEEIQFKFKTGRCKCCGNEVATDIEYNYRKSEERLKAYKKKKGIIDTEEISEILSKYDIGKEALAAIAGFGTVTIKRYYEGYTPAKSYSDILVRILNDENYFIKLVHENKDKLKDVAYRRILTRYQKLIEIRESKIDQIANYIISKLGEVTPLALNRLLFFSNGVNYAVNKKQMICEESQAWAEGPVYTYIYNKYKKYGFKPITDRIDSTHGCMLSKLSNEEIQVIDMVINTFGLFSPKTLERISCLQDPWKERRVGLTDNESCQSIIDEKSVEAFYIGNRIDSEERIMEYILKCVR